MTIDAAPPRSAWPEHLTATGAVRFSRSSEHYERTVAFYRDTLGLPLLEEFVGSFGEDGTILGLPGLATQLEIVRGSGRATAGDPLDALVLYLSGAGAAADVAARLDSAAVPRDPDPHPYWAARDALVFLDPDGRRVVLAPWVFGLEAEPHAAEHRRVRRSAPPGR